ncbi:hypothetical protein SGLAD_v1c09740 [Spiroplasma gladiatoris]|uniref:Uncharacterized protein n=1 Tax=Spiroplasma gladiatoris TaxID=2143 RepID=A0A4P7AK81_9MOLU|nr:hypothetical protein [Spiroplasma gladiatoris]QBQ08173.1 hypothetical protein SGLAD_v1c09740 [Spiroplasma gladiatoris]
MIIKKEPKIRDGYSKNLAIFLIILLVNNIFLLIFGIILLATMDFSLPPETNIFDFTFINICILLMIFNAPYLLTILKEGEYEKFSIYLCVIIFIYSLYITITQIVLVINILIYKNPKLHKALCYLSITYILIMSNIIVPIVIFTHKFVIKVLNKDDVEQLIFINNNQNTKN